MHHDEEGYARQSSQPSPNVAGALCRTPATGSWRSLQARSKRFEPRYNFRPVSKELTAADAEDSRIAFRVGINVGDVVGPKTGAFSPCDLDVGGSLRDDRSSGARRQCKR